MIDELKNKINDIRPPYSEPVVVYLLVEIYKLLERDSKKAQFKTLVFYRNWVAHAKLYGDAAQDFIRELETIYANSTEANFLEDIYDSISFKRLREEFKAFAQQYNLGLQVAIGDDDWNNFCASLMDVIADCQLVAASQTSPIKSFSFKSRPDEYSRETIEVEINFRNNVHYTGTTNLGYM